MARSGKQSPEPVMQFREVRVIPDGRGRRDGSVSISFSSETPVERYDDWTGEKYVEVLSHDARAIDLTYAAGGLPLLADHDRGRQIGKVEDLALGPDKKLRGVVRFGSHPDASWIGEDIRNGIRERVSVGYRTGAFVERQLPGGLTERRYTSWTPLEISSVSIPADTSVGVGRGVGQNLSSQGAGTMSEVYGGANLEQERASTLAAIASIANRSADLPRWLAEGRTVDQVRAEVTAQMERDAIRKASETAAPGFVDLTPREHQQFSIVRALNAVTTGDWRQAGFEREVSDTIQKQTGRSRGSFSIPLNLQVRASVAGNVAGTSSLGGAGVQTTVLSLIELLRNRMQVRVLGATVLPNLTSNISFPRQITANTATWTGENPSSAVTKSSLTLDNVTLSPKTIMSQSAYSRQILVQSSPAMDALVSNDLMSVIAQGIDLAAMSGTGASNQPTGIASQSGVIAVTMGTNGAVPTFANIIDYETQIASNNADIATMGFLTSPGLRGVLKGTLKNTVAGSQYIWGDTNQLGGYRAEVSNQVRSNLTKGTATTICHEIFFGAWSEVLIGEFGGSVDVLVDPYSLAGQNMIQVTGFAMADVGIRHPKAFAYTADARLS